MARGKLELTINTRGVRAIAAAAAHRPCGPEEVEHDQPTRFVPDATFEHWIRETFIEAAGALSNRDHQHLLDARIGVLWTNCVNVSKQRGVLATAEIPQVMGSAWKRGRSDQQLLDWFEQEIDFLLTFYAPGMHELSDRAFCAVVEHELYHCAQKLDRHQMPMFDRQSGRPLFAIRGHDVEEFVGVVARYGITSSDVQRLVDAAKRPTAVADAAIDIACGTCLASRAAA